MKQQLFFLLLLLTAGVFTKSLAQNSSPNNTQVIKGTVTDKASEKPIAHVTVNIIGTSVSTKTDSMGHYILADVPVGRKQLSFTNVGYKMAAIPEVLLTTGKQVILDVALEENVTALGEVVVSTRRTLKGVAGNEFAGSSARSFSTDEISRYAGGRNDPARLASNFAGVSTTDDSRNDIVVRGNSPSSVLWRMEGIPIPNPNHFTTLGTTGGSVSAINTNALKTSDFYTSAFPAEYGNATGAVFDIALRTGNKDKFEKTIQLNMMSGIEALLEGPLSKTKNGSSFLIGYRYSIATIAQSMGLDIGTSAPPKYQDIIFNLDLAKSKLGKLNIFGIGGLSNISIEGKDVDPTDFFFNQNQDTYFKGGFGAVGLKYAADLGKNTFLRSILSYSYYQNTFDLYEHYDSLPERKYILEQYTINSGLRLSSLINSKINAKLSVRGGVLAELIGLNTALKNQQNRVDWEIQRNYDDNALLLQPYVQGKYRFTDKLAINAGLHALHFGFNNTYSLEPRASIIYAINNRQSLSFSYGLHSQLQPLPVYLYQQKLQNGSYNQSNKNLDLTKANHFVIGDEWRFATDWRLKTELYYQALYNVPVEQKSSGFSILNAGADFIFPEKTSLVNSGTGTNKGVEFTVEKFFSRGFYMLTTASIFESKYKGSDGIERNSTFNNGTVLNALLGRELKINKTGKTTFTMDFKGTYSGGRYYTPVDLAASIVKGLEVYNERAYNSNRLPDYVRFDARFGIRKNSTSRKLSQTIYMDFQNVTNNKNVFTHRYNESRQQVGTLYQIGFFPDFMYRLQF